MNLTHANPIHIYSDIGYSYVAEKSTMSCGWTSPIIDEKAQFGFCNMLSHFVKCVIEDEDPIPTGEFGKEILKIVFAGYESYEKKTAITL